MPHYSTKLYINPIDVNRRLAELAMFEEDILAIRNIACSMNATGSSLMFPPNGAGLLAYLYGTRELRATFLSRGWEIDQSFGTSGVRHPGKNLLAMYQNVDVACSKLDLPRPRTKKGAGSERLSQMTAFAGMEDEVGTTYNGAVLNTASWHVMVAEDGAVEVSRAIIRNGEFSQFIERIFVHDGRGLDMFNKANDSNDDAIDFDVVVSRK